MGSLEQARWVGVSLRDGGSDSGRSRMGADRDHDGHSIRSLCADVAVVPRRSGNSNCNIRGRGLDPVLFAKGIKQPLVLVAERRDDLVAPRCDLDWDWAIHRRALARAAAAGPKLVSGIGIFDPDFAVPRDQLRLFYESLSVAFLYQRLE